MSTTAPKKRTFRTYSYRGVDLEQLLTMSNEEFIKLAPARIRRRFARGLGHKPARFMKKLRAAKLAAPENEKPAVVKTHMRNMIVQRFFELRG